MKIVMFTNTYLPHVGGVAQSVFRFAEGYRRLGHEVVIVAPEFEGTAPDEDQVIRVPAIQNFNGSDFSVRLPIPLLLTNAMERFEADVFHSHHPFLLGDTALRMAALYDRPLVFTHHTMYERYTHYVPGDSPAMKRFAIQLSVGYCNLCDQIVAPSESVQAVLMERGVKCPITVLPTGIDVECFGNGDGSKVRSNLQLPSDAFVCGHVGRLAEEKNLTFLGEVVVRFLKRTPSAYFLLIGSGPAESDLRIKFERSKVIERVRFAGIRQGDDLADGYAAMNVFLFTSKSETQGMVVTEAMAAGVPVVALDAAGVREVVKDRQNGRLLMSENEREFTQAIEYIAKLSVKDREEFSSNAKASALKLSNEECAKRGETLYKSLAHQGRVTKVADESIFDSAQRLIEMEWSLRANTAEALVKTVGPRVIFRPKFIRRVLFSLRRVRRALSRGELVRRLLKLPNVDSEPSQPGLILIQIDGLSRPEFEKGITSGRLRFLRRLLRRDHYSLHDLYSGVPSTTPAVQGELFYGVKAAVPAFCFRNHSSRRVVKMLEPDAALAVQQIIAQRGQGLLEGGSSYSNIYSGGADRAFFCCASLGVGSLVRQFSPLRLLAIGILYFPSIVRASVLFFLEILIALFDAAKGTIEGFNPIKELRFVIARVCISVLLRELVRIGVAADIARGVPVIHLNLLGFDEQAHRRGPSSAFARWTLKGIDSTIKAIYNLAHVPHGREYEVWIYSDHGQQDVIPFRDATGESLQDALEHLFSSLEGRPEVAPEGGQGSDGQGIQSQRVRLLGAKSWPNSTKSVSGLVRKSELSPVIITALGPLGNVYYRDDASQKELEEIASRMVYEAQIPLVITSAGPGRAKAWTTKGVLQLPEEGGRLFSSSTPFLGEVIADLTALASHPDAGQFVISGWRAEGLPITFPDENGAHAGPGPIETHAFALLPAEIHSPSKGYFRPLDLRKYALQFLGRTSENPEVSCSDQDSLRVMTYNIHSCVGMDSRISHSRIARVIAHYNPDIVALQEVDLGRRRSFGVDQARAIANELRMHLHFNPTVSLESELYGDAVLSKLPMKLVKAALLPGDSKRPNLEPRGAIWVTVEWHGKTVNFINTHFGLTFAERRLQADALVGKEWIGHPECKGPLIVCGDLNAWSSSYVCKSIKGRQLNEVQESLEGHRPKSTWRIRHNIGRIDHLFISEDLKVSKVLVPRTRLTNVASDHLPLIADVQVREESASAAAES